jgi:hypothetical protein
MKRLSETTLEIDRNELGNEGSGSRPINGEAENSTGSYGHSHVGETGVVIGILTGFQESGLPLVDFPENKSGEALMARSTVPLSINQIGSELAITFERGDLSKPIILGCLLTRVRMEGEGLQKKLQQERLLLSAQSEIILDCGKASIVLTRAGKILIRGAYLLSQSSGVNRIKGGSVQIN